MQLKNLILLLSISISLFADSSYQSKCVQDFYFSTTGSINKINIIYSSTPNKIYSYYYSASIVTELVNNIDKFNYDSQNDICKPILLNNSFYGLNEQDYNFAVAIWGVALSFLISLGFIISF